MTVETSMPQTKSTSGGPSSALEMWRLFVVSSAALYLEIVLIRWLGTEVRIFAFFQNLALIASFLGFGIGCFSSKKRGSITLCLAATTALVVLVELPFRAWHEIVGSIGAVLTNTSEAALFGASMLPFGSQHIYHIALVLVLVIVGLFLSLIAIAMIPLGRWVGYYLEAASNTVGAYSVNLLGSLVGIWLLALLAFAWLQPSYWFAVAFALVVLSVPISLRSVLICACLLAVTLIALVNRTGTAVYWSPYQKLAVHSDGDSQYTIAVNDALYMTIANATPSFLAQHPELAKAYVNSSYDSPFQFAKKVDRVLVVGSGGGNDVAAALRHGAAQVDAVEIDPLIYSLGKRLHPDQPYSSPKVHFINNDARNFMRESREKYDVIVFGLLDSHTEFSGYSNVRVDNYVYTEQAFQDAKRLLNKDGVLILKFEVSGTWTWIGQRLYAMLNHVFGHVPITYYADSAGEMLHATVFVEPASPQFWDTNLAPSQTEFLAAHPPNFSMTGVNVPPPTTDDWPYIYHFGRSIPRAYYSVSAVILVLACYMVWPFLRVRQSSTWLFFLLGAGFLLMETQLVTRLALYFGTTWLVNCIALTGILTVLLLANVYIQRQQPERLGIYYVLLCLSLIADYGIPWERVPGSAAMVGWLLCIAYCVPIFFAGVIFTETFRRQGGRSDAFGANMLGAVAGGLTQNLSFIFGMKALLLVAVVIYACAAIVEVKGKGAAEAHVLS